MNAISIKQSVVYTCVYVVILSKMAEDDVFTTFLNLGTFQLRCCLWEGQIALRFHQKYLNLCSEDEQRSGMTRG